MNQQVKVPFYRRALRRLMMLDPGYRKAAFLEQKIDRLYPELLSAIAAAKPADRTDELKAAIEAAKPADRTDELKADILRNLQEYHEYLNNAQAEMAAAVDRTNKLIVADAGEENRKQLETIDLFQQLSAQFGAIRDGVLPRFRQELADDLKAHTVDLLRDNIRSRWQILHAIEPMLFPDNFPVKCLVCGHLAPKSTYETKTANCFFGGGELKRFVCPECGCIFGPLKMMSLEDGMLGLEYSQHYHVFEEGDSSWKERLAFEALKPKKGGKYLNFGAGAWSKTTLQLRQEGWDVYDYEPYAPFDDRDWVIRTTDILRKHKFDGIFSNDVLEHFNNPILELKQMQSVLKPGGTMAHCTGCYEYAFEYTRFHFIFFTGKSLEKIAQAIGMQYHLGERLHSDDPTRICVFMDL